MAIVNTILRDTDWQAIIVSNITAHSTANTVLVAANHLRYWTTGNSALSISSFTALMVPMAELMVGLVLKCKNTVSLQPTYLALLTIQ